MASAKPNQLGNQLDTLRDRGNADSDDERHSMNRQDPANLSRSGRKKLVKKQKEAEAAPLVEAQPMATDDVPLNLGDLALQTPIEMTGDTASPMVGANAAPGPSQVPWADHRAYLRKRIAENWQDAPNPSNPNRDLIPVEEVPATALAVVDELADMDRREIRNPFEWHNEMLNPSTGFVEA